jgi:hypothetical protein
MATVSFTGVKSCTPGQDGTVDVVFTTKYSGNLTVTLTLDCLSQLVGALAEARSPEAQAAPGVIEKETEAREKPVSDFSQTPKVRTPKTISLDVSVQEPKAVIIIFDRQMESQAAYALTPSAATQDAAALSKKASAARERRDE